MVPRVVPRVLGIVANVLLCGCQAGYLGLLLMCCYVVARIFWVVARLVWMVARVLL